MSVNGRILDLGGNQMKSHYKFTFPEGIPTGGDHESISLRMDQDFDPPEDTVGTYEYYYRGTKIVETNMIHEMDKTFTVMVRLDQQWKAFDDLNAWYRACYDPIEGTALPNSMVRTTCILEAQDTLNNTVKNIKFTYCKIKGIKIDSFENGGTEPSRLQLTFIFGDMDFE